MQARQRRPPERRVRPRQHRRHLRRLVAPGRPLYLRPTVPRWRILPGWSLNDAPRRHRLRQAPPLRRSLPPERASHRLPPATRVRARGMAVRACLCLTHSRLLRAPGPAAGTRPTGQQERRRGCPACSSACPRQVPTPSAVRSSTSTQPFALIRVLLPTNRAVSASTEHGPSGCLGRPLTVTQENSPWTPPSAAGFPAPQMLPA